MSEKILLIDGHSILNRAFYGLPDLTNSEGKHTGAVYGFLNILFRTIEEEKPQYLTVAFDLKAPTFRHKMFEAYKGTRKPMPEELREQVPLIKEMLTAMGVNVVTKEGYEADDILGTLARKSEAAGMDATILSGDRDLLQLATDKVTVPVSEKPSQPVSRKKKCCIYGRTARSLPSPPTPSPIMRNSVTVFMTFIHTVMHWITKKTN